MAITILRPRGRPVSGMRRVSVHIDNGVMVIDVMVRRVADEAPMKVRSNGTVAGRLDVITSDRGVQETE